MIIKSFEIQKKNLEEYNIILFYGQNDGLKREEINKIKLKTNKKIFNYDEKQVIENKDNFIEEILTKSLFDDQKIILVNRATDKILSIIEILLEKKIEDKIILINSGLLEKKSKLRNLFEKDKKLICVPFYQDSKETLIKLAQNYLRKFQIPISNENINLIVNKSNEDRQNLKNELEKIEIYSRNKKKITTENLLKLINLNENHSINKLIDNCLAKNQKTTINILNENIFSNDECILILRTFLNKSKKLLKLLENFQKNNDIEKTISSAKPPIFWKDKEIVKKQISFWDLKQIRELIIEISNIELKIKKNSLNSVNFLTDFLLEKSI
tara:strand:+ start:172 stop:1152 length:981 start_codon:yes stop_codon:yes gene_type:complete